MSDSAISYAFQDWFGLQPGQARVLEALYRADAPLSRDDLVTRAGTTIEALSVHLVDVRRALDDRAIETIRGTGKRRGAYVLTDTGRAECRAVVRRIAEELQALA